jgi:REP element-mobilizing transposase RayT
MSMIHFPGRLEHRTPSWVAEGSTFHIRIRAGADQTASLITPPLAEFLITSFHRNHAMSKWWCTLVLIMPDHLHAMLAFPHTPGMSECIREWKRLTARVAMIHWQPNYFDHRLRNAQESMETWHYIRRNPVAKNLCAYPDDWPWWSALPATRLTPIRGRE